MSGPDRKAVLLVSSYLPELLGICDRIAVMSRGSLFRIAGSGEPTFERLASEISAYYILGVEQQPSDSAGDRHRIDVEVRRRDVTIRSRQALLSTV